MNTKIILSLTNKTNNKINQKLLTKAAIDFLTKKNLSGTFEIDLSIITPDEIKKINYQYLNRDYVTNVLSFPIFSKSSLKNAAKSKTKTPLLIGGIVIAYDVAEKEASEKNISTDGQIKFLFLHAVNHLLGNHHK